MAIFLDENSKVIVQGMTGSEGMKHTTRMLASGTNIVGGVNPRKAGEQVAFPGEVTVPVFGDLCACSINQGGGHRGGGRTDPARGRHHRGRGRA